VLVGCLTLSGAQASDRELPADATTVPAWCTLQHRAGKGFGPGSLCARGEAYSEAPRNRERHHPDYEPTKPAATRWSNS